MKSKFEIAVAALLDTWAARANDALPQDAMRINKQARELREAAIAAIQSQPDVVVGGWQPIETAPKDGTRVLLYLAAPWSRVELARWYQPWGNWQTDGDEPDPFRDEYCGIGSQLPTHWQPLPPPPVQAQGSDAA